MNAPLALGALPTAQPLDKRGSLHASEGVGLAVPLARQTVIVVGGGPAGIRVAQELSRRCHRVVVFNAERWEPYNRVKLTPLLARDVQFGEVSQPLKFQGPGTVELHSNSSIIDIDRERKTVTTGHRREWSYDKLILCVGSRAYLPSIPGIDLSGVYTFRNFDDAEKLLARSFRSRRTAVIGGGLLGLEAARGMASHGIDTCVIEHEGRLMARQLDTRAGLLLAKEIEAIGLTVRTGKSVARIVGVDRVEALELAGGEKLPCDTVIVCTGIRPNMELAREVGLQVGRGIKVNARMQTSDPDIYAIGECAEFEGNIYGLVGPAFEQATIAAAHLSGEALTYAGSVPATKLKVVGADVFSMGDVEQLDQRSDISSAFFEESERKQYRRLILKHGRLIGALGIGDWPEVNRLQEAVKAKRRIWPWQRARFKSHGKVWPISSANSVHDWPRPATICNCTGVTRGQIADAIAIGSFTLEEVKRDTGASTVCGSCKPLIEQLLGGNPQRSRVEGSMSLVIFSVMAALLTAATISLPVWPVAHRIDLRGLADHLWLDDLWKQISGFTLLGLASLAAVLSLRKRIRPFKLGRYTTWRIVHTALGAATLLALFAHTGFRLGSNLNMCLMLSFLGVAAAGGLTGLATALEHRLFASGNAAARLRSASFWLHLIACWPLPLLLAVHILSFYVY